MRGVNHIICKQLKASETKEDTPESRLKKVTKLGKASKILVMFIMILKP